jgi:hypothetical protein
VETLSESCIEFMLALIADASDRLGIHGIDEIKNHPWFDGIEWEILRTRKAPYVPKKTKEMRASLEELKKCEDVNSTRYRQLIVDITTNFDEFHENEPVLGGNRNNNHNNNNNNNRNNPMLPPQIPVGGGRGGAGGVGVGIGKPLPHPQQHGTTTSGEGTSPMDMDNAFYGYTFHRQDNKGKKVTIADLQATVNAEQAVRNALKKQQQQQQQLEVSKPPPPTTTTATTTTIQNTSTIPKPPPDNTSPRSQQQQQPPPSLQQQQQQQIKVNEEASKKTMFQDMMGMCISDACSKDKK